MIKGFEVGKFYVFRGEPNRTLWNMEYMNIPLNTPMLCIEGSGNQAVFDCQKDDPTFMDPWTWWYENVVHAGTDWYEVDGNSEDLPPEVKMKRVEMELNR